MINMINMLAEDITKVLTFQIVATIKKHYKTLDNYKRCCASSKTQEVARFVRNFHIDSKITRSLTIDSDGKRHFKEVLARIDPSRLMYKGKSDIKYKSGKMFRKLSTWFIPFATLEKLFKLDGSKESPFNYDSDFFTARQRALIQRYILGYKAHTRRQYSQKAAPVATVVAVKEIVDNTATTDTATAAPIAVIPAQEAKEEMSLAAKAEATDGNLTDDEIEELCKGINFVD